MSTGTPHYAGHRARLRERLLKDSTALADYEILELLLGYALLRRDTKPLAKELLPRLSGSPHEELWTATVDAQNRLLTWERLARGTVGMVPCYPRDILERVLQRKASGFFLVHNHPGGTPKASPEDVEMTRNIQRIATSMGLRLLDHLIVGDGACYSIREDGLL